MPKAAKGAVVVPPPGTEELGALAKKLSKHGQSNDALLKTLKASSRAQLGAACAARTGLSSPPHFKCITPRALLCAAMQRSP